MTPSSVLDRRPGLLILLDPARAQVPSSAALARAAAAAGAAGILIGSSFDGAAQTQALARAVREAAQCLVKQTQELRDHADVLIREAEAALFESQQALRAAMSKRP